MAEREQPVHQGEAHAEDATARTNWLRAAVLGANDGIVSVSGLVLGVAAATPNRAAILTAGLAGLVAGALSMAVGEYVSVSTQRDTERAMLDLERRELAEDPHREFEELVGIYQGKGLTRELAEEVAEQLTARDAFRAHAEAELGMDPERLVNPWAAAVSSLVAFTAGALLPLLAILLPPPAGRVPVTVLAVLAALALTGSVSARLGGAAHGRATARVVAGGALAMAVTYGVGSLVGRTV